MSWRDTAQRVLGERDNRDNRDKSAPAGPAAVPAAEALSLLRSWCEAIEALDPCRPRGMPMGRWQKFYDCSVWWIEAFGRQAVLDGWGTSDVFGIVRQAEGYGGLVDQLGDHRGLVMTADEARWRWRGVRPQVYRRGSWPDLAPDRGSVPHGRQ